MTQPLQYFRVRVRVRLHPRGYWVVETKRWYEFDWQYENMFSGDDSYERAKAYGQTLKYQQYEEIE